MFGKFLHLLISIIVVTFSGCSIGYNIEKVVPADASPHECVILVHGLGRTKYSMDRLRETLIQADYVTVNIDYPSRKNRIKNLAADFIPPAIAECMSSDIDRIHFVTHSLGGIVIREAIKTQRPEKLGKVVMLSPPNQGSELVDYLSKGWVFPWFNGPAGVELSTDNDSTPNKLGPVDYPVGIIAGNKPMIHDLFWRRWFEGPNDGKVSVERTKLAGMTDFIIVPENHSFIMNSKYVQEQTIYFLKNGYFKGHDLEEYR